MVVETEYYDLLQLQPSATQSEIKKAYKRLAVRWHPDKNPDNKQEAEATFKQIAEAYAILCDPDKRAQYDRFGKSNTGDAGGSGFSGGMDFQSAQDLFNAFFGGRDPFAEMFGSFGMGFGEPSQSRRSQTRRSRDPFQSMSGFDGMFGGFGGFGDSMFGGGGFGGMGSGSSMSSTTISFGSGPGESVSTHTVIENGRQVTRTVRTIRHADGRVEKFSDEHVGEPQRIQSGGFGHSRLGFGHPSRQQLGH